MGDRALDFEDELPFQQPTTLRAESPVEPRPQSLQELKTNSPLKGLGAEAQFAGQHLW